MSSFAIALLFLSERHLNNFNAVSLQRTFNKIGLKEGLLEKQCSNEQLKKTDCCSEKSCFWK